MRQSPRVMPGASSGLTNYRAQRGVIGLSAPVTDYLPYRGILSAAERGRHAMDSLPTGATQSWFIVAAVGLSPMLVFFVSGFIGRVLRRKWWVRRPGRG
jgi:hypothetical protein